MPCDACERPCRDCHYISPHQELQKIANEIRCLRRLQHPNIIEVNEPYLCNLWPPLSLHLLQLLDVVHWASQIGLIMSHAGQTLFELSSTRGVGFKHREVLQVQLTRALMRTSVSLFSNLCCVRIGRQVLRGVVPAVAYAHDSCVCHRDLKP